MRLVLVAYIHSARDHLAPAAPATAVAPLDQAMAVVAKRRWVTVPELKQHIATDTEGD